MEEHTEDARAEEESARLPASRVLVTICEHHLMENFVQQVKIAVQASLIANFALCVLQCNFCIAFFLFDLIR